jgi:hypothetical protein
MSMRLYNQDEFFKELQRVGFKRTDQPAGEGHQLWLHEETDTFFSIPTHADQYPDWMIDEYLAGIKRLYKEPAHSSNVDKAFMVTEKTEPANEGAAVIDIKDAKK